MKKSSHQIKKSEIIPNVKKEKTKWEVIPATRMFDTHIMCGEKIICNTVGSKEETEQNAQLIVIAVNMHDELLAFVNTTKEFFYTMPKGQFGKISCDIGLMNDLFLSMSKLLK